MVVPLYGKLVDRLPRIKLVIGVSLAFAAQLVLFYAAILSPALKAYLGLVFFAWVGVFSVMLVAQFWAYANDLYDKEQGARLFPMVALGASVGAAAGSQVAAVVVEAFGVPAMLLLSAALLVVCSSLFWLVERRESRGLVRGEPAPGESRPATRGGFGLVLRHRYLLLIALFALVYNWVNSNGEYMLSKLIKADADRAIASGEIDASQIGVFIGESYSRFFRNVNLAGVLLQFFVVSRLVKWLGLPKAFLFLPVLALGNALVVALLPVTGLFKIGKTAENATDYSLNNTLKQMLWLVTTSEMKFKAKQVVDTFCVRIGDVCSALSVFVAVDLGELSVRSFAWVSIALALAWLSLAVAIGRRHRQLSSSGHERVWSAA
jgi:AAA family ATP:ADP antiporter